MHYKLYTTIDITHSKQKSVPRTDFIKSQEQNFNTVLQTLGLRANVSYFHDPSLINIKGSIVGFNTDLIINVWRFDFETERDFLYQKDEDPVAFLKDDFELVPYISGLNESIKQNYNVFVTKGEHKNIVFYLRN